MRSELSAQIRKRLESAVRVLCPIIEHRVCANNGAFWSEYALRRELVGCILGSQVRHETATTGLDRIEQAGLLDDEWWCSKKDTFEHQVFSVLSGKNPKSNGNWRHRFPKNRAHQIAKARNAVAEQSLSDRLSSTCNSKQIRQLLVVEISGLGPKQASMVNGVKP